MWTKLAHIVLKNRLALIIGIGLITAFMGYKAREVQFTYSFFTPVPATDPDMMYFQQFRTEFGEDANIVAIGLKDSSLYTPEKFTRFMYLSEEIQKINGVIQVVSIPLFKTLVKDTAERKFRMEPLFTTPSQDQHTLDSMLTLAMNLRFYSDQIINRNNGATFILISLDKNVINTKDRDKVIKDIEQVAFSFRDHTDIELHFVGLPYIRTEVNGSVKEELKVFLVLSLVVCAIIMTFFFRSWDAVVFPLIIIGIMVIWAMGTLSLLGYKITILTGLLPPVIVVIGIPNCVYLLSRYHQQMVLHKNKARALSHVISKIGVVTLVTNATTAAGFISLMFTGVKDLKEFGLVAGLNIMATFIVTLILIPAIFSYLPVPSGKQLKHLRSKVLDYILTNLDLLVHRHRYRVLFFTGIILVIGIIGVFKMRAVTFIVDDVPESSQVKKDLRFFEENFSGIMPLEIVVDSGKKRGIIRQDFLEKVDELEQYLSEQEHLSKPVSIVSMLKASRQAFYNNNPDYYSLPTKTDRNFILRYFSEGSDQTGILKAFVDSTQSKMRISLKVADIGSVSLDSLLTNVVNAKLDELFGDSDIVAKSTGTTLLFVRGNGFLIDSLKSSMILAFSFIALMMALLFRNWKIIIISLVPNLVPLIMTAAIMGYFDIFLRPSTVIIFSVVFGIAVDAAIHFLAKYRQELYANNFFVPLAISKSIRETGPSMIYTAIILFAGFIIFSGSQFVSTTMLGVLTSTTLIVAMLSNLILLPALLMVFDDGKRKKSSNSIIEHYEFYLEADDEEIDSGLLARREESKKEETNISN